MDNETTASETVELSLKERRSWLRIPIILFLFLIPCFWPFRLLRTYAGFAALMMAIDILGIIILCTAGLRFRSRKQRRSLWWLTLFIPISVCITTFTFGVATRLSGFRTFSLTSTSMSPTVDAGDSIMADMRAYSSKPAARGDIVIFHHTNLFLIKRLVARAGDTVLGKGGDVWVNGERLSESYVRHSGLATEEMNTFGPITVAPGEVFLLGDSRDDSLDSRLSEFGRVTEADITGKALYIIGSKQARIGISLR
ncbi:MAG: signal peptidase I [Acidobacteriaceae bacterium]|nr:signal peptidase I [Acidobacteriaceae bacterium]